MKIGDLVCFKWHAAFLEPKKSFGKTYGTEHIPLGMIISVQRNEMTGCDVGVLWHRYPDKPHLVMVNKPFLYCYRREELRVVK